MRIAVITDIHSNPVALTAVLDDICSKSIERIYCCGDIVGYYPFPNEVIDLVRRNSITSVAGSHDLVASGAESDMSQFSKVAKNAILWTQSAISAENLHFLRSLPRLIVVDQNILLFHGSITDEEFPEMIRIKGADDAGRAFRNIENNYPGCNLAFFGHTHVASVFVNDGAETIQIQPQNMALDFSLDRRYLINPGSVCLSRSEDPRASFVIYDLTDRRIMFYKVEYDNRMVKRAARKARLEEYRILRIGRRFARRVKNRLTF